RSPVRAGCAGARRAATQLSQSGSAGRERLRRAVVREIRASLLPSLVSPLSSLRPEPTGLPPAGCRLGPRAAPQASSLLPERSGLSRARRRLGPGVVVLESASSASENPNRRYQ